ncbi:probable tetraacyldisaccharide 4'-kinase, mitochondrial [Cucurbita pepo subsp. pepo]|uniref:probable tetraacyldisaccharide 4'-kinase, mitochondrial n=1 Tax=Cucurbita pepo subsp. pepo TaxID=3664 RepID=UPI000C9D8019|nr:probable tetraacyldisaccharide 4'-kinase, mitochondrial [Cucurbita pepo subsp. pepo]XP_023523242.1 probable tetraacyldisaccharide 4'-kinase, mitochondrial [Cucurbita pepo subsp. pepo]XP_023523243.1 probable tetraacyldisaccharide 4'-kinase, mitochondrial [Cucurbita pepo subsp. pepo]XP_023523244.1 probable tetraacyldisaccharide 4'-kinase, mitochondrial [Cucurbita pepo subsp. pepo]XP_023523245.1 probable tetraacyldisaccharide 4'-kinase, mitochondrial [Cucurbita pepo subsp. pepo]XP_023523246.1 
MEKLKKSVIEIAHSRDHAKLSSLQRSLIPFLYMASSLYKLGLSLRHRFYLYGICSKHRLPVPVVSVGNLTWGGNGKTPMVEFIALWLASSGISPLILNRGYAGGDEAKMLRRHLAGSLVKVGIGADRRATAAWYFNKYGYVGSRSSTLTEKRCLEQARNHPKSEKIGAIILDDGMQHWSLHHDLEIVMFNGITLWGNGQLIPLGPLREPLAALEKADVAIVHHANLISAQRIEDIIITLRKIKDSLTVVFTEMAPSFFFEVTNVNSRISLGTLSNSVVLCVSAIGSADAFVQTMQKIGAYHVDRLDFTDHHMFQDRDMALIKIKLEELEKTFASKPVIVVTEKDYDRDPAIFENLHPYRVLALRSQLKIMNIKGCNEDRFEELLEKTVRVKLSSVMRSSELKVCS